MFSTPASNTDNEMTDFASIREICGQKQKQTYSGRGILIVNKVLSILVVIPSPVTASFTLRDITGRHSPKNKRDPPPPLTRLVCVLTELLRC